MCRKLYYVELTEAERAELEALVSAGNHSAQKLTRARILLKSDEGWSDPKIADALDCGRAPSSARVSAFLANVSAPSNGRNQIVSSTQT